MDRPLTNAPHVSGHAPTAAEVSQAAAPAADTFGGRRAKLWRPRVVLFTKSAYAEAHGRRIAERLDGLGVRYEVLKADRLPALSRGKSTREAYRDAKNTLAVVRAPAGQMKLQPIPPSADFQFHLARGCPAHCQYCYLAGSLPGAPITRAYANLDALLDNVRAYAARGTTVLARRPAEVQRGIPHAAPDADPITFEASCYTDPLALEHLTGSLSATIEAFAETPNAFLRWVTKYDCVEPLIGLDHGGRTRCRISLNAAEVARRLEGGTADLPARLAAMRRLSLPRERGGGGYPVGAVLAPLMPIPGWRAAYAAVLDGIAEAVEDPYASDLTFELITHRFTPGSKEVLLDWYPATKLDLDEGGRAEKRNKFGGVKYVYAKAQMAELRGWFAGEIAARFGAGRVLYFT